MASGGQIHPKARHIIFVCNDRIDNLPLDFPGFFVIEESYFDMGDRMIEKHYLFMYKEDREGKICLTSYNLPKNIPPEDFINKNKDLRIDYNKLEISPRFQPLLLEEIDNEFFGENVSTFAPETLFKFSLRVSRDRLLVKELLERNGVKIAGYETPIIYQRAKDPGRS